jgi:tRNA G18 (ribose-2'-O)-methylase SpoU
MKLTEILAELKAKVLANAHKVDQMQFEHAAASDLMSEVLAIAKPDVVLITGLCTPQVVRTAEVVGIPAVIVVRRENLPSETVEMAETAGIVLAATKMSMFEACGRLYAKGIRPIWEV